MYCSIYPSLPTELVGVGVASRIAGGGGLPTHPGDPLLRGDGSAGSKTKLTPLGMQMLKTMMHQRVVRVAKMLYILFPGVRNERIRGNLSHNVAGASVTTHPLRVTANNVYEALRVMPRGGHDLPTHGTADKEFADRYYNMLTSVIEC